MADIRINSLPTTATSSSSGDFLAIDGTTNGTRKLSAYSPTFGGNLGIVDINSSGIITSSSANAFPLRLNGATTGATAAWFTNTGGSTFFGSEGSSTNNLIVGCSAYDAIIRGASGISFSANAGSSLHFRIGNTGNATLAGNLTVSGTGTSSFAGNLLVTNSKFSFWDTGDQATNGYLEAGHFSNGSFIGTVAGTNAIADLIRFGTSGTERMRLNSSGNLLIAATVDSGNGKLQLATHTTSAGGIGFGTDVSLYRGGSGYLFLSGDASGLYTRNQIFWDTAALAAGVGGGITFGGNYTGTTKTQWASINAPKDNATDGDFAGGLVFRTRPNGSALTTALTLDSSQRCILSGALRLNNAYTAGAPTATGYVTLQDSAGNTYKVLVGT